MMCSVFRRSYWLMLAFWVGSGAVFGGACSDDDSGPNPDARVDSGPGPDGGDAAPLDAGVDGGGQDAGDADSGPPPTCLSATGLGPVGTNVWQDGADLATVAMSGQDCARSFVHSTTATLVDDYPSTGERTYSEPAGGPSVSTNNTMFDALYAMALQETQECSVAAISDGAYNGGNDITCPAGGCFETGRKWTFVWTRDTAYAVDLALGALDPTRARNSLEFKLSELRGGGGRQIIQDTGSGGSYPVSSDRAVWAIGAWQLLKFLNGAERTAFLALAWDAVRNTIEHDREVVWDPAHGLYLGEQSFLDWREQSYPLWTKEDTVQIAASHALSTNVGHLRLLTLGAWLAGQQGDPTRQTQFQGWADALRASIDTTFFHADLGLWGTFTTGTLDRAPVRHFDLLGSALAITSGVGSLARRAEVVRHYPHLPQGPSVIWPQQKEIAIYHNRGIWPFVTAYWLRAAAQVRNDTAVSLGVRSLMRGAAMNLSNMENLECVSGAPHVTDGIYSGPVVNSQRQLWSVAGYLSMVHDVIFGLDVSPEGIRFRPYLTRDLRNHLFGGADRLVLNNFPYRGRTLTVVVTLPAAGVDDDGAYALGEIRLNGVVITGDYLTPAALQSENVLEVTLVDTPEAADTIVLETNTAEYRNLFAPLTPFVATIEFASGHLQIGIDSNGETTSEIAYNIYRDGVRAATGLAGSTTTWVDLSTAADPPSHCYTVESSFLVSGNHSQHAKPVCYWGNSYERIQHFLAAGFILQGGSLIDQYGKVHVQDWGEPSDTLTVTGVSPGYSGDYLIQVNYGNGAGPYNTGITCAVKRIEVVDEGTTGVVGSGVLVMPHLADWANWSDSSLVKVTLDAAKTYEIRIFHDGTTLNMSDFQHNALYGGTGGAAAYHYVNISEIKLLSLTANP